MLSEKSIKIAPPLKDILSSYELFYIKTFLDLIICRPPPYKLF